MTNAIIYDKSFRLKVPDRRAPWVDASKATERTLLDMFEDSETYKNNILDELIKDCIHSEVAGIVSGVMAVRMFLIKLAANYLCDRRS